MGCKNACLKSNTQNEVISGEINQQNLDPHTNRLEEEVKDQAEEVHIQTNLGQIDLIQNSASPIDPTPVQSALRGYLYRKDFEPQFSEFKANHFQDIEKLYEKVEEDLQDLVPSEVQELEKHLQSFHLTRPQDNISVQHKNPVKLEDGRIYSGEWNKAGKMHGIGTVLDSDGSKIVGIFQNGQLNGKGRKIDSNGIAIEGEFRDGQLDGEAKMTRKDGAKFEGNYENGVLTGKGKEQWQDGMEYEGEYLDGKRHGLGLLRTKDGVYEGSFRLGKIHGKGVFKFGNGNVYKGKWKDNKMHGKGKFRWNDGREYVGNWKEDLRHGRGVMKWSDGKEYDGCWEKGAQNGEGKMKFLDKKGLEIEKNGVWVNGVRTKWLD